MSSFDLAALILSDSPVKSSPFAEKDVTKKMSNSGRSFNPFPHNDTFWHHWETSLLKTLWEKEKLLVASNFSFSHSVF